MLELYKSVKTMLCVNQVLVQSLQCHVLAFVNFGTRHCFLSVCLPNSHSCLSSVSFTL